MTELPYPESCPDECRVAKKMAPVFKALGDYNRLCIVYLLAMDETGRLGVGDLARELGISQPAVSQHLKILKNEGIVESERIGFHVFFSFNRSRLAEIDGLFHDMQSLVQSRCDKQIILEKKIENPLNIVFICFSYTGTTKALMEGFHAVCGGDFVLVKTKKKYGTFTAYTTGCISSRKEEPDPVTPESIDVSDYDLLVLGVPVWAWKPAPASYSIISGLIGCEGKKVVICTTCCNNPGDCLPILRRSLEERGVTVVDEEVFLGKDAFDHEKRNEFVSRILDVYKF
ncbi:metalloregulator ArsR/SmtB family transcription factor [Methanospirillum stamsii]|uniref:ArsR family transcriptional regulator n=1 Tax=Methanospirillum stamsii TaxID=1277351 RepID=A0A2V2NCJ6_9EURY|nr:metalloregulator ArsR/SmtB family transcription factor [Methanospirillum stamsii]PWR76315.1 ArsR family transcriptional regulator [Methanospirillum stamsii]